MSRFKLVALHVPSQENIEYGPWEAEGDPVKAAHQVTFAMGFVSGFHAAATEGQGKPEDLTFDVVEIPDEKPNTVVGVLTSHASATVTHADGTTD